MFVATTSELPMADLSGSLVNDSPAVVLPSAWMKSELGSQL
jgi:hypothetical protein